MKKHFLFSIAFILLLNFTVYTQDAAEDPAASSDPTLAETAAAGTDTQADQEIYYPVEGLENWHYTFDISDYPEGKYNLLIKGTDMAGNEYFEGPFNILIDPESDKPMVNISNPSPGMRVGGNLNIVGTCVDDDSVSGVEISINDGTYLKAEGTDFWSYYLDTADMADGTYTLSARGIDENGTTGEPFTVEFVLDKTKPLNAVTSFENGVLLNGKTLIEGTADDPNGIETVELSTDGGNTFSLLSTKTKKGETSADFSIKLNTEDLEDGPHIYWFRSTDRMGSSGVSAFLFFVDNKAPELDILYPVEDSRINGKFRVTGSISDEVGIESLKYRKGKEEPVEIPLSVGDPYWFQDFDFSNETKADIVFTLTDRTGNTTDRRLQLELDRESDLPVITVLSPEADSMYKGKSIFGFVQDDDGVSGIRYSLDGTPPVEVPAQYSFNINMEELTSGNHKLEISAVDINGVVGEPEEFSFTSVGAAPVIAFDTVTPAEGTSNSEVVQGAELDIIKYKSLNGTVRFTNPSGSLSLSINGAAGTSLALKKTETPGVMSFSIPFKTLVPGFTGFRVSAEDKYGETTENTFYLFLQGTEKLPGDRQIYSTDSRFSGTGTTDSMVHLSEGEEIYFVLNGRTFTDAELVEGSDFLSVETSGRNLVIKAEAPGVSRECRINASLSDGSTINLGPFSAAVDSSPPSVSFDTDIDGIIITDSLRIAGTVNDNLSVDSASYSINSGTDIDLPLQENAFDTVIPMETEQDGEILLRFKIVDSAGNTAEPLFLITKDTAPPEMEQITPLAGTDANGKITFSGRVLNNSKVQTIEFSDDGVNYIPFKDTVYPAYPIDLTLYDSETTQYSFRLTDEAGNSSVFTPEISIESESDKPVVQIQIPRNGELIQNDFTVSGMVFDDDAVEAILYRLDEGDFVQLEGANNFEIQFRLDNISDNRHTVEIKALDPGGVESETEVLEFNVSRNEPVSIIKSPAIDSTVRKEIIITGESSDENGIKEVYISYDNGNSYNKVILDIPESLPAADGTGTEETDPVSEAPSAETEQQTAEGNDTAETVEPAIMKSVSWHYSLNTAQLDDGTHSLLIKAVDSNLVEGLYTSIINIDNTAPSIELSGIFDGFQAMGSFELKGRVEDSIKVDKIELELKQLNSENEGEGLPRTAVISDIPAEEIILRNVSLEEFETGWINVKITASDKAGNSSVASRNIEKIGTLNYNRVSLFSPAAGESQTGYISVQGRIQSTSPPVKTALYSDGFPVAQLETNSNTGYFNAEIESTEIGAGPHLISIEAELEDGSKLSTEDMEVFVAEKGPWVKIDNYAIGDFVSARPWITGTAGYIYDLPDLNDKALKAFNAEKEVDRIEVSLDNGRSFSEAKGDSRWQFRLETQDLPDGEVSVLVRARFRDGTSAVTKTRLVVDDTPPRVEMKAPEEGMHFNDAINLNGIADDAFGLKDISVTLREGDKSKYQLPAFIQGLYADFHFLGSTYTEIGAGLTFFDDNVKLQVQVGKAPEGRFNGYVMGLKLLANIAVIPYEYFFGYDWSFLSSSFAVGATFNYFTMTESELSFTEDGLVLGALIGQIELAKITLADRTMFSSFSLYTEGQLWFISSDVSGGVEGRIAFGLRSDIF